MFFVFKSGISKWMGFFITIKNSIYSPEFYASIPTSSFWKAFRYLLLFFFILAIIQTIILSFSVTNVEKELRVLLANTINSYPEDLEVSIQNGQVSTNADEPVFIPMPASSQYSSDTDQQKNFIVIDTQKPFSATAFNEYNSVIWLTKDAAYYSRGESRIEAFDLSQIKEGMVINKSFIEMLADKVRPYLSYITPALIAATFLGTLLGFELKLIYLLLLALGILLLGKIMKWGLSYGQSYKVGMYAITLGILVEFVIGNTDSYLTLPRIPFLFTVITFVIVFINLRMYQKKEEVVVRPATETAQPQVAPSDTIEKV